MSPCIALPDHSWTFSPREPNRREYGRATKKQPAGQEKPSLPHGWPGFQQHLYLTTQTTLLLVQYNGMIVPYKDLLLP